MNRSVTFSAAASATSASRAAESTAPPFSSNCTSQCGKPACITDMRISSWIEPAGADLDRLNGPHQVDQAVTFEVAHPAERGGGGEEDALDLLGAADELAAGRQERHRR